MKAALLCDGGRRFGSRAGHHRTPCWSRSVCTEDAPQNTESADQRHISSDCATEVGLPDSPQAILGLPTCLPSCGGSHWQLPRRRPAKQPSADTIAVEAMKERRCSQRLRPLACRCLLD